MKRNLQQDIIILGAAATLSLATLVHGKEAFKSPVIKSIKPAQIQNEERSLQSSDNSSQPIELRTNGTGNEKAWDGYQNIRKKYRSGELGDEGMWAAIMEIADDIKTMTRPQQAIVLQTQATLMEKANQPILSAIYAAQAIKNSQSPLDEDYKKSWQILRDVSRTHPIQNLIESVAAAIPLTDKNAPGFGSDWNYFLANALMKQKNGAPKALELYRQVKKTDRYYLPSKFQEAMILQDANDHANAVSTLKKISDVNYASNKKLSYDEFLSMKDHINMALGRLLYENRQFGDAIKYYRLVRRDSAQFYDSIFEQSWALFLAGYPNHALGMIHAVRSPFFKETFNPEATMLASIIYYWMCRYDDARVELAAFITDHQKSIQSLEKYLSKGITDPKVYYRLFEDTVMGVSSESLGLPREILVMASTQDNLLYVRGQYASVIKEIQALDRNGVFGSKDRLESPREYLEQWASVLRDDIGIRLHRELSAMKEDFERLYDQGQFLYVELLMSKKDQLLGKELHSETKIDKLSQSDQIRGWGKKTFSWASDDKQEFWADELGFHIYRVEPLCVKAH